MLRSLYAGISGLRAEQTMLDVTSNNIANVNTVGFKSSSVQFEDALSQTISAAGLPLASKGGTNPNQVGLGVKVAAVSANLGEGSQETTGNNLDLMVAGDGYFVTKLGSETLYTRNGSLHWDSQGRLSTANGGLVQGWPAVNGQISSGATPTTLSLPSGTVAPAVATTKATVTGNLPAGSPVGTSMVRQIDVYAADGTARPLAITYTAAANNAWNYSIDDGSGQPPVTGTLQAGGAQVTGATSPKSASGIAVDMSGMSGFAGMDTTAIASQDGTAAGTLLSTTINSDGTLSGTFSNGAIIPLARLSLATFANPGGLEKAGDSTLRQSMNSGVPRIGVAGSSGFGDMVSGALEGSNVDLSEEFTNLIIAQRGFQANARIITTSDQILQDLTQLKQ